MPLAGAPVDLRPVETSSSPFPPSRTPATRRTAGARIPLRGSHSSRAPGLPSVFISADSLPGRRIWPCFPSPPAVTTVPKARRARAALPSVPPRSGRPRSRLGACALALACRAPRGGWGFPRQPHPSPSPCLSRVWRPLSCLSPRVSPLCARSQPDPPYLSRTFTLITSSRSYK